MVVHPGCVNDFTPEHVLSWTRAGRVLLVRHARTDANSARQRMGRRDLELSAAGRAEAIALGEALAAMTADEVWTSPLRRAIATAAAIAAPRGLPVDVVPDLIEMDFGVFESPLGRRPKLDVKGAHRREPLPGGECLHDVWLRACGVAADARRQLALGRNLVVVGHYRVNQLLVGAFAGSTFDEVADASVHRGTNASAYELAFVRRGEEVRLVGSPRLMWAPDLTAEPVRRATVNN